MVVDDLFGVIHTAVTDFDGDAVKYLVEVKSEAIHETGLSGKCSCVLFSS